MRKRTVGQCAGHGFLVQRKGQWNLSNRVGPAATIVVTPRWGMQAGDRPVTGDWNGDGTDAPGIFRKGGYWHLSDNVANPSAVLVVRYGLQSGDVPVVGDWHATGADSIGVYRPSEGRWYLRRSLTDGSYITVKFGQSWLVG